MRNSHIVIIQTTANTDNKGKLFVTVFAFHPAHLTESLPGQSGTTPLPV